MYLSPERLARPDTIEWLRRVPISHFAIDEAHCISEWGHEFRPEYRKLSGLRDHFPDCTIAAFTASATRPVRHDIIEQLRLRDPHKYIASFHRPNLRYIVKECDPHTQENLLVRALRRHAGGSVIVYSPTIRRVGETVAFLEGEGIPALPYHGKMDAAERRANQERWMSDEVRVLVGTIAFGLGINKAAVRAVIHLSLPKSVEQYYQEAGRAGRDGLLADCILLWQKRDVGLLTHFIEQTEDPGRRSAPGSDTTPSATSWMRPFAGIAKSACTSARWRNGNRAAHAMSAAADCNGWNTLRQRSRAAARKSGRAGKRNRCGATPPHQRPERKGRERRRLWGPDPNSSTVFADGGEIQPMSSKYPRLWCCTIRRSRRFATNVPVRLLQLREVRGIGELKAERYGRQILDVVGGR